MTIVMRDARWLFAAAVLVLMTGAAAAWWLPPAPVETSPPTPVDSVAAAPTEYELTIESVPPGAALLIGGVYVGRTPTPTLPVLASDEGIHVELRREGYHPVEQRITWPSGQHRLDLRVELERVAPQ